MQGRQRRIVNAVRGKRVLLLNFEVSRLKPEDSCIENEGVITPPPPCEKYRVEFYISKENHVQHPPLLSAYHTENLKPSNS